jgi:hypothetical protein
MRRELLCCVYGPRHLNSAVRPQRAYSSTADHIAATPLAASAGSGATHPDTPVSSLSSTSIRQIGGRPLLAGGTAVRGPQAVPFDDQHRPLPQQSGWHDLRLSDHVRLQQKPEQPPVCNRWSATEQRCAKQQPCSMHAIMSCDPCVGLPSA